MRYALSMASRSLGISWPNPSVGCVIVNEGEVVGKGCTQQGGRPHAEAIALSMAGKKAQKSTMYVTLEPCCHHGQTAPCTENIIKSGVSKIFIATLDFDTRVNGKGIKDLKESGMEVHVGLLKEEAEELNEGFFKSLIQKKPFVTLKLAASIDGKIATSTGSSKWITGEESRKNSHYLRARNDAIMVSSSTILSDNPELSCRLPGMESYSPVKVILDSKRRVSINSKVFNSKYNSTIIIYTSEELTKKKNVEALKKGINVFRVNQSKNYDGLDLDEVLRSLSDFGITRLMVESGMKLSSRLILESLVDKLVLYRSSSIIGNDGLPFISFMGVKNIKNTINYRRVSSKVIDKDVLEVYTSD
ncbi:bifunctional diaminohydroxyphosphoribosylaminopyrimidine deaminase/5-amino-6-(5-phosphoribosylamino)uracil reductase RibD [Alphaproteobacteria bacterium]|nr:bifunctional diaminohydroxyphosphoribosylaminopyrimidine deaminase/5-amino-6-(5-phosphoribosylamino)uracil reductase RibD [Alphaproteobacteria bacterium]